MVNIGLEDKSGSTDSTIMKRAKAMMSLMQNDDIQNAAEHLFKKKTVRNNCYLYAISI